jgi:HSP90 family molecular chaperone
MTWQENGGDLLGQSGEAAAARAREAMREKPLEKPAKPDAELTEEEREQRAKAQQAQEELEKSLATVQAKADDPDTPPEQRQRLEELAENMERMLAQMGQRTADADEWERVAQSDKARGILGALARGERLPDDQWNKLLSTLDDGLWQVRGRKPPEDYRKAIEQYQEFLRQSESGDGEN